MYQILKNHFSRYTPEMVERYCGVPKELFLKLAETYCSASGPEKTGVICYAVGWTQHSRGVQMIRAAAILQLLLGNIGRPGGGILALRGHASIQGSTDIPTLYDILPEARSETWFMYHLGRRLREKASKDPRPRNAGLSALTWNYATEGQHQEPKVEEVLQEINGYTLPDRKLVSGFAELQADGSTACGCWIYSGVFPQPGQNKANGRSPDGWYGHGWGFAWPADRRILYNRASARPDGTPWSERKKLIWWDEQKQEWTGFDVPDFTRNKPPSYEPRENAAGDEGPRWRQAFCHASGRSGLDLGPRRTEGRTSTSALRALGIPDSQSSLSATDRPSSRRQSSSGQRVC